jgi:hypothetical protein
MAENVTRNGLSRPTKNGGSMKRPGPAGGPLRRSISFC